MRRIIAALVVVVLLSTAQTASAHVLITDSTRSKGAILHIIPDDDPVAGEKSMLYFDTQDRLLEVGATAVLTVRDVQDGETVVPTKIDKTLVTADYIFPLQGVYHLTYTVESGGKTHVFNQSQRVSRGAVGSALDRPLYVWAEMLSIGAGTGFVLLALTAFRHRKEIAKKSTF